MLTLRRPREYHDLLLHHYLWKSKQQAAEAAATGVNASAHVDNVVRIACVGVDAVAASEDASTVLSTCLHRIRDALLREGSTIPSLCVLSIRVPSAKQELQVPDDSLPCPWIAHCNIPTSIPCVQHSVQLTHDSCTNLYSFDTDKGESIKVSSTLDECVPDFHVLPLTVRSSRSDWRVSRKRFCTRARGVPASGETWSRADGMLCGFLGS